MLLVHPYLQLSLAVENSCKIFVHIEIHISVHSRIYIVYGYQVFFASVLMIFTLSAEGCFSVCAHRRQLFDGVAVAVIADRHAFRTALPAFMPAAPVAASESDLWPGVANKCRRFVPYPSPQCLALS